VQRAVLGLAAELDAGPHTVSRAVGLKRQWATALSPVRDLGDGVTGTWRAIKQFANNPSWSNLANMSGDLALEAGSWWWRPCRKGWARRA
jgi:hypothetical protein